jgi:hypothetical protein
VLRQGGFAPLGADFDRLRPVLLIRTLAGPGSGERAARGQQPGPPLGRPVKAAVSA